MERGLGCNAHSKTSATHSHEHVCAHKAWHSNEGLRQAVELAVRAIWAILVACALLRVPDAKQAPDVVGLTCA